MWTLILNRYVIGGVVVAALLGFVFHLGASHEAKKCDVRIFREQIDDLKARLETEKANYAAALEEAAALRVENQKIRQNVKTIIQKVPAHVPDNRACDLSPDTILLLNAARRGDELPAPAGDDAGGRTAPADGGEAHAATGRH